MQIFRRFLWLASICTAGAIGAPSHSSASENAILSTDGPPDYCSLDQTLLTEVYTAVGHTEGKGHCIPVPAAGPRDDCTLADAVDLDLKAFRENPERFAGRCVHVRGIIALRSFFPDMRELYGSFHEGDSSPIGIYPERLNLWNLRTHADVVAFAYSCERWYEYSKAEVDRLNAEERTHGGDVKHFVWLGGNCHYGGGAMLWVSHWTPLPGPTRLTGPTAAREYGDLDRLDKRSPVYAATHTKAAEWFELVRTHNQAGLAQFRRQFNLDAAAADESAAKIIASQRPPYPYLTSRTTPVKLIMLAGRHTPDSVGPPEVFGCVCLTADCTNAWPIARIDIVEPQMEVPYVCLTLEDYAERGWRIVNYPASE